MAEKRPKFDPYAVLRALDRHRVDFVLIGGLARVLQGTEELTRGTDIVPSTRGDNLERLQAALQELGAAGPDGEAFAVNDAILAQEVIRLETEGGEVKVVPTPAGTRGYDDLRRAANREPLGQGIRPRVASIGDLARMAFAYDRERFFDQVRQLRRLTALERSRSRVMER